MPNPKITSTSELLPGDVIHYSVKGPIGGDLIHEHTIKAHQISDSATDLGHTDTIEVIREGVVIFP